MAKTKSLDEMVKAAQAATAKTRMLLEEAHTLHASAEVAHERAEQLHAKIRKQRAKARKLGKKPG
jgi:hypothetical protein